MRKRQGLVLIELVVVIALLWLLTTFMLPALQRAAKRARQARPPTSLRIIDEALKDLELGNIVFNAPESMRYNETETIELLLSHSASIEELRAQLEENGEIDANTVRISNRMEARLSGSGFKIEALGSEIRAVGAEGVTQWKWYVTGTAGGSQRLHLTLSAILIVSDRDVPSVIRTFDRKIHVTITPSERFRSFFSKHWKFLLATMFVPLGVYFWKQRRKTKPKPT